MTYEEMCGFEALYKAYLNARKRKRRKRGTAEYEAKALQCTDRLSILLSEKKYAPGKFETFYVCEPKRRLIQAPAFVDKVVLHAVTDNVLYSAITSGFIRDNYASQLGKGTHDGLARLKFFMNEYYRKYGTAEGWVLKCDVHHFFASIDHGNLKVKLKALLDKRGVDPEFYDLLCLYIDKSEGLPLGYQSSQLLALMYLDEFDHIMKEKYRIRAYGRFMDDFFIIGPEKKALQNLLSDIRRLMEEYKLELNQKTKIFPLRNGIDFLGFHSYLTDTGKVVQKLRHDSVKRMRNKIRKWKLDYPEGKTAKEDILKSFEGWDAHAAHGDTYSLRRKLADQVENIIGEKIQVHRKINSNRYAKARRQARQQRAIETKDSKQKGRN